MDSLLALRLHEWVGAQPWQETFVVLMAQYGVFALPVALAIVWIRSDSSDGQRLAILVGSVAALVAFGLGLVLERTLGRPRPFVELGFAPLLAHAADSSFPSDHTLTGVALVGALVWRAPRAGGVLILWAVLVGLARAAAGLHYVSDVIGSAVLALVIDGLAWLIVPRFIPRIFHRRVPVAGRGTD